MAHEDVANLVLAEQRVVDRQHRAAGIAEQAIHALILQRLDDHFGAGHLLRHRSPPYRVSARRRAPEFRQQKRPARGLGHAPSSG
jgi:hypothetical protein